VIGREFPLATSSEHRRAATPRARRLLRLFLIGAAAGLTPFLFTQALPAFLYPTAELGSTNWPLALILAPLVGVIVSVIYNDNTVLKSRDIFLIALGIPQVFVGVKTTREDHEQIADERAALASEVLTAPRVDVITQDSVKVITGEPDRSDVVPDESNAIPDGEEAARPLHAPLVVQLREAANLTQVTFFVVIGDFSDRASASRAYDKHRAEKLNTERYAPKHLQVLEIKRDSVYVLIYSRHSRRRDALKVYQLLRINDPRLPVRLLEWRASDRVPHPVASAKHL
jgi:hypothetical protein